MDTATNDPRSLALPEQVFDEAQLAAAAFLARYQGRTLDTYRVDPRVFFEWAADVGLEVLSATRPHIELFVRSREERGLGGWCQSGSVDEA